jgi:transposase
MPWRWRACARQGQPPQAGRFAEATGKLAKTDSADAAMLARMGVALDPSTRSIPSEKLARLKELHLARQALIKDRTAAKNQEKIVQLLLLKKTQCRAIAPNRSPACRIENEMEVLVTKISTWPSA